MRRALFILGVLIAMCACASKTVGSPDKAPSVRGDLNASYDLRLHGVKGQMARTAYRSDSAVEDLEDGQKVRDQEEIVDFVTSTEITDVTAGLLTVRTKTLQKDGTGSLHDFAFPEPEEQLDFIYTPDARVMEAGSYPKNSIFFLPPISLPPTKVKIGDTWTMDHAWVSANDGLPLTLDMVTIFKDVVPCGVFGACADLEVSGDVAISSPKFQRMASFKSKIWGRILFSFDRGDVVWSEVRSREFFKTGASEMHVLSCMTSVMQKEGASLTSKPVCHPSEAAVVPASL